MSGSLLRFLLPAFLAGTASADRVVGTFDVSATDSAAVRKIYAAEGYSNPASARALSVSDGALTLTTTLAADAGKDYSAQAGILIPLNNLWTPTDIRMATAISFRIKGSGAYNVNFSLGSDAYPRGKDGVVMVAPLKVTTAWAEKSVTLQPTPALAWLSWMEDEERFPGGTAASVIMDPTDPNYANDSLNVAMSVKYVQFAIDPTWKSASTWSAPAAGVTTLTVDDIVVVGLEGGEDRGPFGVSCAAGLPSMVFSTNKTGKNAAGGDWFAYTDNNASGLAQGTSSLILPEDWTQWRMDTALGAAPVVANLDRPATSVYGGFAGIGTGAPEGASMNLTGLAGIGFAIALAPGSTLDKAKVGGVHFKVSKASVGDSATHEVFIPAIRIIAGSDICVDTEFLKMPAWMLTKPDFKLFSPEDVTQLSWEIKIEDQTGRINSVPNQGFMVGPVTFYGFSQLPAAGVGPRAAHVPSFAARYHDGSLSLRGLQDYASLEIRTLTGTRVATLAPSASVRIRLDRGAYLLVARGEGKPALSRTLAVAR